MRVHLNNPERTSKDNLNFFAKACVAGMLLGAFFLLSGITLKWLAILAYNNWITVVVGVLILIVAYKFFGGRKNSISTRAV